MASGGSNANMPANGKQQPTAGLQANGETASLDAGNRGMALVFLLLIIFFGAAGLALPDRAFSPQENRYLAMKPVFSLQKFLSAEYMGAIEEYVTDQFPGRDAWVSLKALCQRLSGQKENNGVYFAADGYLIGKPKKETPDVAGRNLAAVLALKAAGYDTALLVSPMAAEILRDKLPARAYTPEQADLMARLRREAPDILVDVESALRLAASGGRQVFFRTDHHWTTAGAYEAYRMYMEWLGEEPQPLHAFKESVVSADFYGTLWSKNSLPGTAPDHIAVYEQRAQEAGALPAYEVEFFDGSNTWQTSSIYQAEYLAQKDKYAYFLGQNRPLVVVRRQNEEGQPADKQKLLIFKDSYAHCFAPFLLPHFDEIHLIDLRYWKQDPIAYMEAQEIRQVLFLYNADSFSSERSISLLGAYSLMPAP